MWPKRKKGAPDGKGSRRVGTYHCPQCNSTNINQEFVISIYMIVGYSLLYYCQDCGYKGMVVYNDFDNELEDKTSVQITDGTGSDRQSQK